MKLELFLAKHFHYSQSGAQVVSRPAVRIATIGIAVGVVVILLATSIIVGFKKEIERKVIGFGAHIQIVNYDRNSSFETVPITVEESLFEELRGLETIGKVQRFATKPAIVKTDEEFQGVVLKGVGEEYDLDFLREHVVEGEIPIYTDSTTSKDVMVSKTVANQLGLKVGDALYTYFMTEVVRVRKFNIAAIYQTNISDYDKAFLIVDIHQIQHLNGWEENQVSGLELKAKNYKELDAAYDEVFFATANRFDDNGSTYYIQTIREANPQIFGWLDLLDMNAWIILVLMLSVAGFDIISGLLILIIERTNTIGILKAMGETSWSIRKVFLYQSTFLIGKGMLWGNVIGVALILIQYFTHAIPLDATAYYVSYVPVDLSVWGWIGINVGVGAVSLLMLIGPSYIITRISPAKSIKFE